MLLGSIGLRAKDFFFASNMVYFLMLLFCGVNIPPSVLPGWMSAIGRASRSPTESRRPGSSPQARTLGSVAGLVLTEVGVAAAYAAAGYALFRVLERESRRSAVLDAY